MSGRAGLEGIRPVLLLQDVLVLGGDAGGQPDVDVPLGIGGRVVPGIQRQDDLGWVADPVAQLRRVPQDVHVLPERRGRVHAEYHFTEACRRHVRRAGCQRRRVAACAVVRRAVALRAVQPRVGRWCPCSPAVRILSGAALRHRHKGRE